MQDPSLFRGTRVSTALHRGARVFSNAPASAEDFERSEPVDGIDSFISHNWSTSRSRKFFVLLLHFNAGPAALAALVAAFAACVASANGVLATTSVSVRPAGEQLGLCAALAGNVVFVLVLLFGHECRPKALDKSIFLDKVCVHQTDEELKRKGIENLAAFMYNSRRMVVLYSEVYLQRLWTVYEVASFLMLHPGGRLQVRPMYLPVVVLSGMAIWFSYQLAMFVVQTRKVEEWVDHAHVFDRQYWEYVWLEHSICLVALIPASLVGGFVLRRWAQEQLQVRCHVERFRVRDAQCFCEEDRACVQKNIVAFMKYFDFCVPWATEVQVFEEFEALVRREVPQLLLADLSHVGVPWRYVALVFSSSLYSSCDFLAARLRLGMPAQEIAGFAVLDFVTGLVLCPLGVAAIASLARWSCRLRGVWAVAAVSASGLVALLCSAVWMFLQLLRARASTGSAPGSVALLVLLILGLIALEAFAYRRSAPASEEQDDRGAGEASPAAATA